MIPSPLLADRDRYERSMDGRVDNVHDDAFTHRVRLVDDDFAVEVSAVCTASPSYQVREAAAWIAAAGSAPVEVASFRALAGARMVGGFTRRLAELVGDRPGAALVVDAGVEVARLARQVARMPSSSIADLRPGDARRYWQLDTTGWVDLPNSCFTYSAAGRALLDVRPVTTSMTPELYSPPPGATGVFRRKKLARLLVTGRRLHLFNAMHDNAHGFDLHYEVDLDAGTIVAADSITSRLPYQGICTEPQDRIQAMLGERVDSGLRKRIQHLLGGERGCAQLYDLTADVLKLLAL
jgi:Protein of unknown function (DUF2889)